MNEEIAVLIQDKFKNENENSLLRAIVFHKDNGSWLRKKENYVNITHESGIESVREEIKKLIECLGGCRVAVGSQLSGVLYRELDNSGFSIFEAQDFSPETLDGILRDLEEERKKDVITAMTPKCPVETETPGVFYLDLLGLREAFPEMSSKQVLREFLETTPFYELRLRCAHVPPWLEGGLYAITTETGGDGVMAVIRHIQCGGG
jgi:hypothetical protein